MDHHPNFKNLILDDPRDALRLFAADEAVVLERARIVPIREEQLKERLSERFQALDIPLLLDWPDGRRAAILLVLEEETEGRRFSIDRLAHDGLDLAELFEIDRVVLVVIFLHPGPNRPRELILGGDDAYYLTFHSIDCELPALHWTDDRARDNGVARPNLPNMSHPEDDRVAVYAWALRGRLALEPDPERQIKYLEFVDIDANLNEREREGYRHDYPEQHRAMTSFQTRFEQRGIEIGEHAASERVLKAAR